jgi:hypothetical protein
MQNYEKRPKVRDRTVDFNLFYVAKNVIIKKNSIETEYVHIFSYLCGVK